MPDTKDRILFAAEELFADKGFDGAGMKAIAKQAGVAQGLLHYHFGDKSGLYAAIVEHRSKLINRARMEALAEIDLGGDAALEEVLFALLRPTMGDDGGGTAYARIFSSLAAGAERDLKLVEKFYDETARAFIAAIQQAETGITKPNAAWAYNFAIGSLVTILGRTGRPEKLGGSSGEPEDVDAVLDRLVTFAAAGVRALRQDVSGGHR